RITKFFEFTPKHELLLKRAGLWQVKTEIAPAVAKTRLQDIAAFYRQGNFGLFASIDFPFSQITTGSVTRISYPPFEKVAAGQKYECHSLTFGATKLNGHIRGNFDEGEIEAMDDYVQHRFPPRFNRPMNVYCFVVNRYTQPAGRPDN